MQKSNQKIEYTSKHLNLRKVLFIIFLLIALFSFGIAIKSLLSWQTGYREIESEGYYSDEIQLQYYLENKAQYVKVKNIYNESCKEIYQLLDESQIYDGIYNIAYINSNPNQKIKVDDKLYNCLALLQKYNNKSIMLAPIYELYKGIFGCNEDYQLVDYDPLLNEEIAQYVKEVLNYINDENHIQLKLYDDNYVELYVSEQYQKFAEDNGINSYLDFYWIKNSFVVDYVAQQLINEGFNQGFISCHNGYCRFLSGNQVTYHYYDELDDDIRLVADIEYSEPTASVQYRNYRLFDYDFMANYTLENGEKRTCYIDEKDGLSKTSLSSLTVYSHDDNCSTLLLKSMKYYITDNFDAEKLNEDDFYYYYMNEYTVEYNDNKLKIEIINPGCKLNLW